MRNPRSMSGIFSWSALFEAGGPTLIFLLACAIVSYIIIIERWLYFRGRTFNPTEITGSIADLVKSGEYSNAGRMLLDKKTPAGYVLFECLQTAESDDRENLFEEIKARAIGEKMPDMEKYLNIIATLGSVSPFIGLLGTVFGIIRAFVSIGQADGGGGGAGGLSGLNTGIAEALVATAAGLFVAIPATAAYNFYRKKVDGMVLSIEVAASRLKVMIIKSRKR